MGETGMGEAGRRTFEENPKSDQDFRKLSRPGLTGGRTVIDACGHGTLARVRRLRPCVRKLHQGQPLVLGCGAFGPAQSLLGVLPEFTGVGHSIYSWANGTRPQQRNLRHRKHGVWSRSLIGGVTHKIVSAINPALSVASLFAVIPGPAIQVDLTDLDGHRRQACAACVRGSPESITPAVRRLREDREAGYSDFRGDCGYGFRARGLKPAPRNDSGEMRARREIGNHAFEDQDLGGFLDRAFPQRGVHAPAVSLSSRRQPFFSGSEIVPGAACRSRPANTYQTAFHKASHVARLLKFLPITFNMGSFAQSI
jgi:hypothetical protein